MKKNTLTLFDLVGNFMSYFSLNILPLERITSANDNGTLVEFELRYLIKL